METGLKLKDTIQFGKKTGNSPNQQSPPQEMYSTKKTEPPKGYTFYQSTRNPNNSRLSFQTSEIKKYNYVSERLEESRRKTLRDSQASLKFNTEGQLGQNYNAGTQSAFKKSMRASEAPCVDPDLQKSKSYTHQQSPSIQFFSQLPSSGESRRYISTELVESKIITRTSDVEDQNKRFTASSSEFERKLHNENQKKYQNIEDEYYILREKFSIIESQNKMLEKRNLDLVQEMLSSESVIRQYEEKQAKYEIGNKKYEDSIKISRNIITSLNERIARLQKQNEQISKTSEEHYQTKLLALENSKSQALKALEALVFELKLKIIDQNHELQNAIQKEKKRLEEENIVKIESVIQQERISGQQKDEKINFLETEIEKLNQLLVTMDSDLMKMDQQNMRLDVQNNRLTDINKKIYQENIILDLQNKRLTQINSDLMKIDQENTRLALENHRLIEVNSKLVQLQPEVLRLQMEKNELQTMVASLNQMTVDQLSSIEKMNEAVLSYKDKLGACETAIEVYRKEKEFQSSQIQNLKNELEKLEEIVTPTKKSAQIDELKEQISSSKEKINQLYQTLDVYIKAKETSNTEASALRQDLNNHQGTIAQLRLKIKNDKEDIESYQRDIAQLRSKCKKGREDIQSLEEQIQQKDGKIAEINTNFMKAQLQVLDLKQNLKKTKIAEQKRELLSKSQDIHESCKTETENLRQKISELQQTANQHQHCRETVHALTQKIEELECTLRENQNKEILPLRSKVEQAEQSEQEGDKMLKLSEVIERIESLQKQSEQKQFELSNLQSTLLQKQSELSTLQSTLLQKQSELSTLQSTLLQKQSQVFQLTVKLDSLQQQKQKSRSQRQITNEYLSQQFNSNLQLKQRLKIKELQKELLQSELVIIKNQIVQLEKEMKVIEHYKFEFDNRENTIIQLELKVKEAEERELLIKAELEDLKELVKQQQEEYLVTLDQEIKKICMIEDEDSGQFRRLSSKGEQNNSPSEQDIEEGNSLSPKEMGETVYEEDQTFQDWLERMEEHSKEELISKIQQLNFVNKSLKMKVSDINQMQQNSNDMIMGKIKLFQEIIQKYEQDITELQENNQRLAQQNKQFVDRSQFLEGKIEWMDISYKEVEAGLQETNEELLKVQLQYINLKMVAQDHDEQDIQEGRPQRCEEDASNNDEEKVQSSSEDITVNIQQKQIVIEELKIFNKQMYEVIEKIDKSKSDSANCPHSDKMFSEEAEVILEEKVEKILQEEPFDLQDREINKFIEGQYQVKESSVSGITYSIVVSKIDSEDDEEEEVEESPDKNEETDRDMDKMIEEFPDQLFEEVESEKMIAKQEEKIEEKEEPQQAEQVEEYQEENEQKLEQQQIEKQKEKEYKQEQELVEQIERGEEKQPEKEEEKQFEEGQEATEREQSEKDIENAEVEKPSEEGVEEKQTEKQQIQEKPIEQKEVAFAEEKKEKMPEQIDTQNIQQEKISSGQIEDTKIELAEMNNSDSLQVEAIQNVAQVEDGLKEIVSVPLKQEKAL